MDIDELIRNAETELESLDFRRAALEADRVAVRARLQHLRTVARCAPERGGEQLQDAIVRVISAAGGPVTLDQVLSLLRDDGVPVASEASAKTLVAKQARPGGPLRKLSRGLYITA